MPTEKEIAEFLELDKDNIELVEGLTSCFFAYGEASGMRKGRLSAWAEIVHILAEMDKKGKVPDALLSKVSGKFLAECDKENKPLNTRSPALRVIRMRERATWRVLKRRLKSKS